MDVLKKSILVYQIPNTNVVILSDGDFKEFLVLALNDKAFNLIQIIGLNNDVLFQKSITG